MQLDLHIPVVPQSLQLLSSHSTNFAGCYAAHFTRNGKLLMGCHDGIRIYSENYKKAEKFLKTAKPVISISSHGDKSDIFYIEYSENEHIVKTTPLHYLNAVEIFRYDFPGFTLDDVAASSKFAVARGQKSLAVYNYETKLKTQEKLSFQPNVLRFDAEENLLVTSPLGLHKYSLDDTGRLTTIWMCSSKTGAAGIAFTRYGNIVVQNTDSQEMHIISPRGLSWGLYS